MRLIHRAVDARAIGLNKNKKFKAIYLGLALLFQS